MANSTSPKSLVNILKDPSEIEALMNNPGRYGMDFYNGLSTKNKQYLVFAAAAGLIVYGLYLSQQKE